MDEHAASGERVSAVLATFDASAVHRATAALPPDDLAPLASVLGVPRRLLLEDAAAARVLRRRTLSLAPGVRPEVALMLAAACNDDTVAALGPRHEDPTIEDMIDVLDAIVERHGANAVALMLAAYVDSAAPCATVFAELLDTDERFALGALDRRIAGDTTDDAEPGASADSPTDPAPGATDTATEAPDPEREVRRRERKERDRAEKEHRAQQAEAAAEARRRMKEARRRSRCAQGPDSPH